MAYNTLYDTNSEGDGGDTGPVIYPNTPGSNPAVPGNQQAGDITAATSALLQQPYTSPLFWQRYGVYGPQFPNQATQIGAAMYSNIQPMSYLPPWALSQLPQRMSGPGMINGGMMSAYGPTFEKFGQRTIGNPYPINTPYPTSLNVMPNGINGWPNNPFTSNQLGGTAWGGPGGGGFNNPGNVGNNGLSNPFESAQMSSYGSQGQPQYGSQPQFSQPQGQYNPFARGQSTGIMSPDAMARYGIGGAAPMRSGAPMGGSLGPGGMAGGNMGPMGGSLGPGGMAGGNLGPGDAAPDPRGMGQYGGMAAYGQDQGLSRGFGQANPMMASRAAPQQMAQPKATMPLRAADSSFGGRDPYSTQAMMGSAGGNMGGDNVIQPGRVPGGDVWETAPNRTDPGAMSGLFGFFGPYHGTTVQQNAQNYADWYTQTYGQQAPYGSTNYYRP